MPLKSLLALIAALLAGCSVSVLRAPTHVAPPVIQSADEADRVLAQAAKDRSAANARFAAREAECYRQFFVNSCLEDAREVQRASLDVVRTAEVEAARVKRALEIEARDRELAAAQKRFEEEQARMAAEPPPPPRTPQPDVPPPPPHPPQDYAAEAAAREQAKVARDRAEAPLRAQKAAEAAKRRAEAEQHAIDVARRKAEKDKTKDK